MRWMLGIENVGDASIGCNTSAFYWLENETLSQVASNKCTGGRRRNYWLVPVKNKDYFIDFFYKDCVGFINKTTFLQSFWWYSKCIERFHFRESCGSGADHSPPFPCVVVRVCYVARVVNCVCIDSIQQWFIYDRPAGLSSYSIRH